MLLFWCSYKSFCYGGDTIGDITAKGEAQIAIIDLLGMACGILLSYKIGESKLKIALLFAVLSTLDLLCIVQEIKRYICVTAILSVAVKDKSIALLLL